MLRCAVVRLGLLSLLLGGLTVLGCDGKDPSTGRPVAGASVREPTAGGLPAVKTVHVIYSFIDSLDRCDVDHRGLLLDFGTDDMSRRYGWAFTPPNGIVHTQHDGASWARVYEKRLVVRFYMPEPSRVFVALRALGRDASRVRVLIDGYSIASLRLHRKRVATTKTPLTRLPLDAGLHEIQLRFAGGRRATASDPFAEIDWLKVAGPDRVDESYGAPTRFHLVEPKAVVSKVPHRAIALRAPSTLRCALLIPQRARLRFDVGMRGAGSAELTVRLRRDGRSATELARFSVQGGDKASWQAVDLPLEDQAGKVVAIELGVPREAGTGRLFIGEPRIVVPDVESVDAPVAKRVVVVVLDGVERDDLPPWRKGPTPHLPNLSMLARDATVFSNHRGASTSVAASVASLISGRPPLGHGVLDSGRVLPTAVVTIGSLAREASVVASMFSAVPMTSRAFGFAKQWDDFSWYPPNGGRLASAPFSDASLWLLRTAAKKRALAMIHARGGHPPFDITSKEAKRLPPNDYAGYLGPRRAAQELLTARGKLGRLSEADRDRLRALFMVSLAGQDHALGELIRSLSDVNLYNDTLLIVTTDVSSGRRTLFGDGLPLDEMRLKLPLYVHFPGDHQAGKLSLVPTESYDVTRTVLDALQIKAPAEIRGRNLSKLVSPKQAFLSSLRFAQVNDQYSVRLGEYVLHGKLNQRPRLCHLSVDPSCAFDRRFALPLVTDMLFRQAAAFVASEEPAAGDPIVMDSETAASLKVWGAY